MDVEGDKSENVQRSTVSEENDSIFPDGVVEEVEGDEYIATGGETTSLSWALEDERLAE